MTLSARFEHDVVALGSAGQSDEPGERERRAELLEIDLAFRSIGLGWQTAFDTAGSVEDGAGEPSSQGQSGWASIRIWVVSSVS